MKAIVTGATSGIGYAFSDLLASKGYDLVLVGRKEDILSEMKQDLEQRFKITVEYFLCDLAIKEEVDALCENLSKIEAYVLINNAGFDVSGEFGLVDDKYVDDMINVNVISFTRILKTVLIQMKENKIKGKVLNVSSIAAKLSMPYSAVYVATKSYALNISISLYEEYRRYGITVTSLCPGPTSTNFAKRANLESVSIFSKKNTMSAGKVAHLGYNALMKNKLISVPGFKNKFLIFISHFVTQKFMVYECGKFVKRKDYDQFLKNISN